MLNYNVYHLNKLGLIELKKRYMKGEKLSENDKKTLKAFDALYEAEGSSDIQAICKRQTIAAKELYDTKWYVLVAKLEAKNVKDALAATTVSKDKYKDWFELDEESKTNSFSYINVKADRASAALDLIVNEAKESYLVTSLAFISFRKQRICYYDDYLEQAEQELRGAS